MATKKENDMKKRDTVFTVNHTETYKREDEPGKWDNTGTTLVLAADAEDAIARTKAMIDKCDKADKTFSRRVSVVINSVKDGDVLDIV